ncbi:hypothetical protein UFOVP14_10 [uncultured Caudovirales phage]|uniref:Uncharacterized protein n=1 Tax=uncultured Caudovirales phage TaxID=2100421 RepID=A0A6J5KIV3_9CAUD|nr:hypothetical protein UFOVP14_10 [uncultured Caudovirales phage]
MRQIKYVATNEVVVVEDQVALDAIIAGIAIPSFDQISAAEVNVAPKAVEKAPEVTSFAHAPEIK